METSGNGGGIDTTKPSMARVYDYLLGGQHHFGADRAMAESLLDPEDGCPGLREMVRDNRRFITRAVTWLSARGVRQFIDAGCGLPAHPATHETARAADPSAAVVYVDNDPEVLAWDRTLMDGSAGGVIIGGDLTDPAAVLSDKRLLEAVDLDEPACVILGAVLHFHDAAAAREIVAGWTGPMAPGSAAVVSCVRYEDPELAARMARRYTAGTLHNHSREDVSGFLAGLRIAQGQVMSVRNWPVPPTGPGPDALVYGGVGIRTKRPGAGRAPSGDAARPGPGCGGSGARPGGPPLPRP